MKACRAVYDDIVLLSGARTPFGKFCGSLASISPTDLGISAAKEALARSTMDPGEIDQVVFANITQSSFDAIYLPRHIGLYSGIPLGAPALLVQRICGSGFESIINASEQIVLGKAATVLAGGAENMSLNPTSSFGNRTGYRLGGSPAFKDMLWEGLLDPASGCSMGQTAENLAQKYDLSREDVDEYALRSHQLGQASTKEGRLAEEIIGISSGQHEAEDLASRKFRTSPSRKPLEHDEHLRDTSAEDLARLSPAFGGVQTAGNSSGIVDGAAAVVVAQQATLDSIDVEPLARVTASASAGVEPGIMGIGPVPAIQHVLEVSGLGLRDIDLFEINEAFGAQYLAVEKELGLDRDRVNVNGGAISLGHPLGATGTRLTLTLALEMKRRGAKRGIASACIGGGQGTALLLESI